MNKFILVCAFLLLAGCWVKKTNSDPTVSTWKLQAKAQAKAQKRIDRALNERLSDRMNGERALHVSLLRLRCTPLLEEIMGYQEDRELLRILFVQEFDECLIKQQEAPGTKDCSRMRQAWLKEELKIRDLVSERLTLAYARGCIK